MPVAPNPLLQTSAVSKTSRAAANLAEQPQQAVGGKAGAFDQVLARQGRDKTVAADGKEMSAKPKDKPEPAAGGKSLPGAEKDKGDGSQSKLTDASLVAGQITDAQPGAQLIQAQAEMVTPVLQAAVQQPVPALPSTPEEDGAFDPQADPLDDLPALRLALEQNAQAHASSKANAQSETSQPQALVNTLANLLQEPGAEAEQGEPGDKAFSGLLDDGLKDLKSASSDTRVDDFADRLNSLTQAATAKTANAVPASNLLHQPLAMNQNAWTEGLVNRVMYLSSQNLKSADIQLEPAELGRLDIRVNVAADQQTQVTFMSGHVGVRDALESQVHRLRELFAQQGLAQPDVNVADQSRGQQQQGQPEGSSLSGVAARRAAAGEDDPGDPANAAMPVERQVVVGSSAVDYYA
ncbi:flagellar hook-length control protein FliK [Pseudomonas sp. X10]